MSAIKSIDIRSAILRRFPAQEYAVLFEVADATGAAARRYADAVVMSLWPSRGLEIHGIEIKVSRADYRREAADPAKAESVAQYCDKWSLYTSPGVVTDIGAVPPAWGVEEFDGKIFRTLKRAEATEAAPLSRGFVASLLRRRDGLSRKATQEIEELAREAAAKALEAERAEIENRVERMVANRTLAAERMLAARDKIKALTGVDLALPEHRLSSFWESIPLAMKLHNAGMSLNSYNGMGGGLRELETAVAECRKIVESLAPPLANGPEGVGT